MKFREFTVNVADYQNFVTSLPPGSVDLGAGTTGAAAVRNFRRFVGCDIDDNYVKISQERMKG